MAEDLLVPLIGVLAAAIVAAATSLVVSILSKDQKTSEFRQSWIDAFREDAAHLAGNWSAMVSMLVSKQQANESIREFMESRHEDIINTEVRIARMRLRLNPDEHASLIKKLHNLGHGEFESREELDEAMEVVILEVQEVLRYEWKRVKRGELSFRLLKWSSFFAIAGGLYYFYNLMI